MHVLQEPVYDFSGYYPIPLIHADVYTESAVSRYELYDGYFGFRNDSDLSSDFRTFERVSKSMEDSDLVTIRHRFRLYD